MAKFEINDAGIRAMYAQIATRIEEVDGRLRADLTGKPAAEIEPAAREAFDGIGVKLPASSIAEYAESVSHNNDFVFRLE